VDTALELARQQPLRKHVDDKHLIDGLWSVPPLTGAWQRATVGLTAKLQREDELPRQLPITFDAEVIRGRDQIVLAHLNHPLVAMSTRLLRAAVSNPDLGLYRVTAVVSDDPGLEDVLVGAYSRFVLVGADGVRLHEEVLYAGGWAPEQGRFRRLENLTVLGGILGGALTKGVAATGIVEARIAERWPRIADGLNAAVKWRASTREEALHRKLEQRQHAERERINHNFDQFAASLHKAIDSDDAGAEMALFSRAEASKSKEELAQYRRDRHRREERLSSLTAERQLELEAIDARYRKPEAHTFPVAVVFVVPKREATR
jgi:hypothetical protein